MPLNQSKTCVFQQGLTFIFLSQQRQAAEKGQVYCDGRESSHSDGHCRQHRDVLDRSDGLQFPAAASEEITPLGLRAVGDSFFFSTH
jgi:hypothetical protein